MSNFVKMLNSLLRNQCFVQCIEGAKIFDLMVDFINQLKKYLIQRGSKKIRLQ